MSVEQKNSNTFWLERLKKPSTIAVGSVAIAFGVLGYIGTRWLVTEKLPPFLERQLSQTLACPVDLGEVISFSFNSITFARSTVSVDDDDPDYVIVDRVKVGFNLLPVIFRRVLPLEVTLIDPDIYLEQDENGSWLDLPAGSEQGGGLPIDFDITVIAESGDVALLPNERDAPVNLEIDGSLNYDRAQPQYIEYDLDTKIGEAIANVTGETDFETGKTKAQILVEDLALPKVLSLLPNEPPVQLQRGELNADLEVNFPSFEEIDDTRIEGTLSLQRVQATAEQLPKPLTARSRLRFNEKKVNINNTQASIGDIVARVDGRINWEKGYDVNINLPSFALEELLAIAPVQSPVDVSGKIRANLQLTGAIAKPLLQGTISNTQPITIAETKLDEVEAELAASLERVVLENLSLIPAVGGEVTGRGLIGTDLSNTTPESTAIPLSFEFQAELTAEELLQPYYRYLNKNQAQTKPKLAL